MTEPKIEMTLKEAEALDAELAALQLANQKLAAELATAKTAADKSPVMPKLAEDISKILLENKLVSAEKLAETKANLEKEGGIAAYFKRACELYNTASASKAAAAPARIGKPAEKTASEKPQSNIEQANARFEQRVLSAVK